MEPLVDSNVDKVLYYSNVYSHIHKVSPGARTSGLIYYKQNAAYRGTVFFPSSKPKFLADSFTA